jgi:O-antigen ligase
VRERSSDAAETTISDVDRVIPSAWTGLPHRRSTVPWAIAAALSTSAASVLVIVYPDSLFLLGGALISIAIAIRPRLGAYVLMAVISFFETFKFDNLLPSIPGLYVADPSLGVRVNLLELLLLLSLLSWLAHGIARRRIEFQPGPMLLPVVLFAATLVAGLVYGLLTGGDARIALWELRYVTYVVVAYCVTTNLIRTPAQTQRLMWIFLFATATFAVEGAIRRLAWSSLVAPGTSLQSGYDHTDPIFLGGAILFVLSLQIFRPSQWRGRLALLLIPLLGFTLLATERRAGLIGLMVALLAFGMVLLRSKPGVFAAIFLPLAVVGALYFPLYWDDTSLLGQPARAVQSLISPNVRDAASNSYREAEKTNIRATLEGNQLFGVGFGNEFHFAVPLPDLSRWEFWRYEPHNNVFWVWLKTGMLGFIAFVFLLGTGIARASHFAVFGQSRSDRVVAVTVLTILVMSLVVSYVDVALVVGGRVTTLLGMSLAVLGNLKQGTHS